MRHARINTERVLAETKETLRALAAELEQVFYTVLRGEKKLDETHSKLLHMHTLAQAVTLDIDAQMRSQGGLPVLIQHNSIQQSMQQVEDKHFAGGGAGGQQMRSIDALGLEVAGGLGAAGKGRGAQGTFASRHVSWDPIALAKTGGAGVSSLGGVTGGSSGLESLDLAVPGGAARQVTGGRRGVGRGGDAFLSRVGLQPNMTEEVLASVVGAGGRCACTCVSARACARVCWCCMCARALVCLEQSTIAVYSGGALMVRGRRSSTLPLMHATLSNAPPSTACACACMWDNW